MLPKSKKYPDRKISLTLLFRLTARPKKKFSDFLDQTFGSQALSIQMHGLKRLMRLLGLTKAIALMYFECNIAFQPDKDFLAQSDVQVKRP
jgi:hypothetical protein